MASLYSTDFHAGTQRQAERLRALQAQRSNLDPDLVPIPCTSPFDLDAQVLDPDWLPEPRIRS